MSMLAHATLPDAARLLLEASRHPIAATVARELAGAGVGHDAPVVALASGGGDSTALLVFLAALRERTRSRDRVHVLVLDHGLRAESGEEARSVEMLAAHLGLGGCERISAPIGEGNVLDRARALRLDHARVACRRVGARHALLAHQADDRAESMLLALVRGSGIEALAGILPVRTIEGEAGDDAGAIELVRPLLGTRREALRRFLREVGVPWREDPSNATRTRGAMRGEPAVAAIIDRIADGNRTLFDEASALVALREERLGSIAPAGATSVTRAAFDALPRALRPALVRRLVHAAGGELGNAVLEAVQVASDATDRSPRRFGCGGGVTLLLDARVVAASTVTE